MSSHRVASTAAAMFAVVALAGQAVGQTSAGDPANSRPVIDQGPLVSVDPTGEKLIQALRLTERLEIDGRLDEPWYQNTPAITGFIQSVPDEGELGTERTEAWIAFDGENIYVSGRIWDTAPESEWIANEMRRDTNQLRQNDTFGVVFDTFHDGRNGVMFYTNPLGAMADFAITNEGSPNTDWNPIWNVRTGRFEGGWTVEMEIPFKSLRYRPGLEQTWGVQLRRTVRRRNEWTHITLVPRAAAGAGSNAVFRISEQATLVGLEAPPSSLNLEVKPYAISGTTTRRVSGELSDDFYADAGLDVKYGVTENLTLDLTYNTDFAQVEVDEQQVNLTRFSLVFPEKREFFLEGRGIFDFAVSGTPGASGGSGYVPSLFFSRRIGLQGSEPVPIVGGARLTGKVGAFDVGALSVQTDSDAAIGAESTNFSVLRLRRDILARSSVGALFAGRTNPTQGDGYNQTYGVDATFAFFDNVNFLGYYAKTHTGGLSGRDRSYRGRFSYDADKWGLQLDHVLVGDNFNPEVGLVRRDNFRQSFVSGRYSPRPASIDFIRKLTFQTDFSYLTNDIQGYVEARQYGGSFQSEFENSDVFSINVGNTYESLVAPFRISPGVTIPIGRYDFNDVQVSYNFGLQRRYSGRLSFQTGDFYSGTRRSVGFNQGRVQILPQFSLEPSISFNWVDLPEGSFNTHLLASRLNYSFTPRMFLSGLVQYNTLTDGMTSNVRLRWEYAPGSELFVVFTDDRDMDVLDRFSELSNRGLVIKINRLLRP